MQGCFLCTHTICCSTIGVFSTTQSYTHLPCATSYSNQSAHTLHARESTPLHPLLPPLQTPGVLWELVCFLHTTRYHTPPIHIHARCRDTGTTGSIAARVAITRAQRQLAVEAGIHLNIQSFQVFNSVGAVNLKASLNCDAFASNHSADAHYDRASFVGLAVFLLLDSNSHPSLVHHLNAIAPPPSATVASSSREPLLRCAANIRTSYPLRVGYVFLPIRSPRILFACAQKSTRRERASVEHLQPRRLHLQRFTRDFLAPPSPPSCLLPRSLPGSVAQRQLLDSFSRMLPELLRFSSAHTLLSKIPEEIQRIHRVDPNAAKKDPVIPHGTTRSRVIARSKKQKPEEEVPQTTDLWSGWDGEEESRDLDENFMDMGDASLASLGL